MAFFKDSPLGGGELLSLELGHASGKRTMFDMRLAYGGALRFGPVALFAAFGFGGNAISGPGAMLSR
jgi:hypothetical protein